MTIVEDTRARYSGASAPRLPRRGTAGAAAPRSKSHIQSSRRFGNVSVMGKLLGGFGAVALITLVVGVIGINAETQLNKEAQSLKVDGLDATYDLSESFKHEVLAANVLNQYASANTEVDRQRWLDEASSNFTDLADHYGRLTSKYVVPEVVITNAKQIHVLLVDDTIKIRDNELIPAVKAGNATLVAAAHDKLEEKLVQALKLYEEATVANDADNVRLGQTISHTASTGKKETEVLLGIGLLMAIGLGVVIARMVARPAQEVEQVLQQVAEGDLRIRSTSDGDDELGRMSASLNKTLERTQGVVSTIGESAVTLAQSSDELAASAGQVAANVQTAAAGTEEMTASIQEIARNAQEASRVADEAVRLASESSQMVTELDVASAEIGNVVEMITSIAEQTNLLALNATIEAARAGDAGRGFAVVANEVKELAQNTSAATQSIRAMVEQIQTKSGHARNAIEQITDVIQTINESQITIASAVEEQTVTTAEMARQLAEAAFGATAISGGSDSSTTSTGSARDISKMAADLKAAVGQFSY